MSTSESFAVSMMIGTAEVERICRHTSVPGIPGSIRSSSTMSAPRSRNAVSAPGPSSAISTSYPSRRSRYASGSARSGSSSTRRMRVMRSLRFGRVRGCLAFALASLRARFFLLFLSVSTCSGSIDPRKPDGEGRSAPRPRPQPHLAAVPLRGVLDDRRARGPCRRCDASGPRPHGRTARRCARGRASAMPMPWSDDGDLDDAVVGLHADADPGARAASRRSRWR